MEATNMEGILMKLGNFPGDIEDLEEMQELEEKVSQLSKGAVIWMLQAVDNYTPKTPEEVEAIQEFHRYERVANIIREQLGDECLYHHTMKHASESLSAVPELAEGLLKRLTAIKDFKEKRLQTLQEKWLEEHLVKLKSFLKETFGVETMGEGATMDDHQLSLFAGGMKAG